MPASCPRGGKMATKSLHNGHVRSLANGLIAQPATSNIAGRQSGRDLGLLGWLMVAPTLALISACSSAVGDPGASKSQTQASAQKSATTGAEAINAFRIGVNVNNVDWWANSRPFMNMIYGTGWQMQNTNPWGGGENVPASSLDPNGWVMSVPAGYRVARGLSVPLAGGDFTCRYQGNGQITVSGPVSNVSYGAGYTRFTIAPTYPGAKSVSLYYFVDPTNYIRNIDCRETAASTTNLVAPEFVSAMSGFRVVRFMKWQQAVESNRPVTWATRNKPGDGDYTKKDGVPIEVLVATANQLNADPWFTIPWNADDDYITRFASYVRDNLAPGHVAYVETSNEVWNSGYSVYAQAKAEAIAEQLPSAITPGAIADGPGERYAERTRQVMAIWSNVFAGQMGRIARVAAFQHVSPYWTGALLRYQNTYQSVDAVATAPYFGYDLTASMTADEIFAALPGKVNDALNFATQQKAYAQKYGLRYITYEGGQHIVLPTNMTLSYAVERDPRMETIYNQFLTAWQTQIGDTLTLFALTGGIGQYGSWGLVEYAGQPLTLAPKMRAVQAFLGTAPAPTQTCPDGSVIPSTDTCPTPTTPGGKKKGGGKGGKNATA